MFMFEQRATMSFYIRRRTGMNPHAIPAEPTSVGYPALAGFVRIARRLTVGRACAIDIVCCENNHA
jgi:hypothetical protein